ncbi:hypothetical protein D3C71_1963330 [compost metagenome]
MFERALAGDFIVMPQNVSLTSLVSICSSVSPALVLWLSMMSATLASVGSRTSRSTR